MFSKSAALTNLGKLSLLESWKSIYKDKNRPRKTAAKTSKDKQRENSPGKFGIA